MANFNAHWFYCGVRLVSWSPRSRSIREMVRQYREELSCQTASNVVPLRSNEFSARKSFESEEIDCEKRPSSPNEERLAGAKRLKDKRHVSWHDSLTGSVTQEKICTPLRLSTDDLRDFQDLDRRATDVLRRSQQVIGGRACKSSEALISKSGHPVNYIQNPSYFTGNGHSSPCSSGTAEVRSDKNHCRARDVVARNFEEIDQILGESNLVMEQKSSSDIQHKASEYTKVGKEIREVFKESEFEPGRSPHGGYWTLPGANYSKQDMEAREEAAIKAANYYLHKDNGDSNIQFDKLFENPLVRTEENLASNCRRSLQAPDGTMGSADQAYYPSAFNTYRQQECQSTMSLPFEALESCEGTKVSDKSVPTTTSVTPIFHSEIKWQRNAEGDGQWFNDNGRVDSEIVDFASFEESKGTWKYAEVVNFGESHLDSTKSLELDGKLPMSSRKSGTTLSLRPSTVDSELYPFSPKKKSMNESAKNRDVCSIHMLASRSSCFGQASGVPDPNVPVSESRRCIEKMVRGASHGSLCLEDGMRQLSTEDLLLALENPRKIRASLMVLSSRDQANASCEEQRTYQPEQYLSPGKRSTSLSATEFERSFAGSLQGKDELTTYSAVLASLEQDYEEAFDRTSPRALGSHRYLLKSNPVQRSKVRLSDPATQLLSSSSKCRGTKDRDNKSPPWMHSLNVRKPTKWRAMSVTHTRLQASAASLIKGTVVVEELEELGFRHNRPKDTILAAADNTNVKGRAQEDLSCRVTTAGNPNIDSVIHFCRQTKNPILAPDYTKVFETRKADDGQTSLVFSAMVGERITNEAAQIEVTTTLSDQAGIEVEASIAHCSDSYLNQWTHGSEGLAYGIPLPRESTLQEKPCVTNRLVAQEDSRFDHLPRNSTFPSGLDYLISEVVHEWVEICSAPSPIYSACDGRQEIRTMSPHTTCSISSEVSTNRPVSKDGSSSSERKLETMNGVQVSEAVKSSANLEHFRKVQGSKSLPRDSTLVKDVRKTSVAALASVVQPLLAALQEAQIEESIVTEFEADETVRLLLEKLQLYETKIRALKNRSKSET